MLSPGFRREVRTGDTNVGGSSIKVVFNILIQRNYLTERGDSRDKIIQCLEVGEIKIQPRRLRSSSH